MLGMIKMEGFMAENKKFRVVFPFVEAGLGHIMPMKAIADAMQEKYGDRVEVIRTNFFTDTTNPNLACIEREFAREVKLHNKNKLRGKLQFFLMNIFGSKICLKYLMQKRYEAGFAPALAYIKKLNADLIFNTHLSTLYYSCEAKSRGLIGSQVMAYCPDPIIGRQWDNRADLIGVSSHVGKERATRFFRWHESQIKETPFFIRREVINYNKGREFYRRELGLPEQFTVLLADGAYGAGKLKKTVLQLLKSTRKMNIIAVCGKNEKLFNEFLQLSVPQNITFMPLGFTDKMLTLSAACDLFVGKAGASNLAEPIYFGAPAIVTFRATPVEKWISAHYVKHVGCAILQENYKKAVKLVESFIDDPTLMQAYVNATQSQRRADGAEIFADKIWESLLTQADTQNQTSYACTQTLQQI